MMGRRKVKGPHVNPERCMAAVHDRDNSWAKPHQCPRKRVVGEWCRQHAPKPKEGTGKKLYKATCGWRGDPHLIEADVLKEGPKSFVVSRGIGGKFGSSTNLLKSELERSCIAESPLRALHLLEAKVIQRRDRAQDDLGRANKDLHAISALIADHSDEEA